MNTKPIILLVNDDGITAPGLKALYNAVKSLGDCVIVAPDTDISAVGHGITMKKPIRVNKYYENGEQYGWAVTGTPVDCVKFASQQLLDREPDIIVSGINQGSNSSINAIYSGTVAAAAEGGIMNIPSVAVSNASYSFKDFTVASEMAFMTVKRILKEGLPAHTFLNINVPPVPKDEIAGIKVTRMGRMRYKEIFDERFDPSNRPYYWLKGNKVLLEHEDDTDEIALSQNYVTVAPLICDLTNYNALKTIGNWNLSLNNT